MHRNHWFGLFLTSSVLLFLYPTTELLAWPAWSTMLTASALLGICVVYLIYPFVEGVRRMEKERQYGLGLVLIVCGIVWPLTTGLIAILVLEVFGRGDDLRRLF